MEIHIAYPPFILFSSIAYPLLLLILLSTPFCSKILSAHFPKEVYWTFWSFFPGTSCLLRYSFVCCCVACFRFWDGKWAYHHTQLMFGRDGPMGWDLESDCKIITRTTADCFWMWFLYHNIDCSFCFYLFFLKFWLVNDNVLTIHGLTGLISDKLVNGILHIIMKLWYLFFDSNLVNNAILVLFITWVAIVL